MNIEKHIDVLGKRIKEKVTGVEGVAVSISFDLYGCIQILLVRKDESGESLTTGQWIDLNRAKIIDSDRVMDIPDFGKIEAIKDSKGPAIKPTK